MRSHATQSTPAPVGSSEDNLRFMFRTGENVSGIGVLAGMAPASQTITDRSYIMLNIDDGTSYDHTKMYYPRVDSGAYVPSDVAWVYSESTLGVAANTLYRAYIRQRNFSRIHSITVFELADPIASTSTTGIADITNFEEAKPIYDAGIQELCETGTKLWQHNGAVLMQWSRHKSGTPSAITSATYVNLLQTGSAAVTAATPGMRLNTQYHDSQKGDVPVELGVYAVRTVGAGTCSVKLVDASGTVFEETAVTSGTTFTSTGTITAKAAEKTDIHVKVNTGGDEWEFYSIGLWEYEA